MGKIEGGGGGDKKLASLCLQSLCLGQDAARIFSVADDTVCLPTLSSFIFFVSTLGDVCARLSHPVEAHGGHTDDFLKYAH